MASKGVTFYFTATFACGSMIGSMIDGGAVLTDLPLR